MCGANEEAQHHTLAVSRFMSFTYAMIAAKAGALCAGIGRDVARDCAGFPEQLFRCPTVYPRQNGGGSTAG